MVRKREIRTIIFFFLFTRRRPLSFFFHFFVLDGVSLARCRFQSISSLCFFYFPRMLFIWSFCGLLQKMYVLRAAWEKVRESCVLEEEENRHLLSFPFFPDKNIYSCTTRTKKRQEVASQANVHTYIEHVGNISFGMRLSTNCFPLEIKYLPLHHIHTHTEKKWKYYCAGGGDGGE